MNETDRPPSDPSPPQPRLWTAIPGRFAAHVRAAQRHGVVDTLTSLADWRFADARFEGDRVRVRLDAADGQGWVEVGRDLRAPRFGGGGHGVLPEDLAAQLTTLRPAAPHAVPRDEADLLAAFEPVLSPADELPGGWRWTDLSRLPGAPDGWKLLFSHPDGGAHHITIPDSHPDRIEDRPAGTSSASGVQDPEAISLRALVQLAVGLAGLRAPTLGPVLAAVERPQGEGDPPEGLSAEEIARFHRDGFIVVPGVIPADLLEGVGQAIRWFLSLDPTWDGGWFYDIVPYLDTPGFQRSGTFLELYQHQALWDVRQSPRVHRVFADLWGREDLWVTVDRVNVKPPVRDAPADEWRDPGFVHWDVDTSQLPLPFGVQGLVALTDAGPEHGTFHCAPGFHHDLEAYAARVGPDRDPRRPTEDVEVIPVSVRAGDLLVWHHALPHGNGENRSADVRVAQYVAMSPARFDNEHERLQRVRAWRERLPGGADYEGDPLERERRLGETAALTPLGRRLLGLERWP